ncbi:MAG TPA: PHB depolymerase family esterase [Gemmatimonadaceae bacterium]|nr:PHB depolymerase family esterase [Gemmatimonadaceae bacterium]
MTARLRAALTIAALGCAGCRAQHRPTVGEAWRPGTAQHAVRMGGDDRSFLLHVPRERPRSVFGLARAYPLVILLHGSGASGETVREQSRMDALADARRFLVAYPDGSHGVLGIGSDWNAGTCCGAAARSGVDDVAFIRTMIATIAQHLPVDTRRVYVAGFSDGGRMAYHFACASAASVAAIGVVSGSLVDDHCAPTRPVPLIAFHGTGDDDVPYDDEARTTPAAPPIAASAGLPPSVRFWSVVDRCSGISVTRLSAHVTRAAFAPCAADVVLFTIDSGRHAWPGGVADGPSGDPPTPEIQASDRLVRFFFRHAER